VPRGDTRSRRARGPSAACKQGGIGASCGSVGMPRYIEARVRVHEIPGPRPCHLPRPALPCALQRPGRRPAPPKRDAVLAAVKDAARRLQRSTGFTVRLTSGALRGKRSRRSNPEFPVDNLHGEPACATPCHQMLACGHP
jgi:hypothetical protein